MGVLLSAFYIFIRAANLKPKSAHTALSVLWCLAVAVLYAADLSWLPPLTVRPVHCIASIVFIWLLIRGKPDMVISAFLLSYGISYVLSYIALAPINLAFLPFIGGDHIVGTAVDINKPVYLFIYTLASALHLFASYWIGRIRRYKNGVPFLLKGYAIIVALIAAGAVLVLSTRGRILARAEDASAVPLLFFGVLIIGVGMYIWIKRGIRMMQKKWAREDSAALYQKKVADLERSLRLERDINENLRAAHHSMRHRLAAWERSIAKFLEAGGGGDLYTALSDIRKLSAEYGGDVGRVKHGPILPTTNVKAIDDMFGLFADRFAGDNIKFKLKVTGSIVHMTENAIGQSKLETMIGDHLEDALIAVKAGKNAERSVMAAIGAVGDYYEFTVFDSGIPFDADTLIKLGTGRVTTHKADGGSGAGFMKTFEAIQERKASLIITENEGGVFTKSVSIRFDGEGDYIIDTYRPGEFPPSERYAVVCRSREMALV